MSTDSNSVDSITRVSTPYELTPLSFDMPYEFPRHFLPTVMEGNACSPCTNYMTHPM
jgi:hypothetical protein